MTLDEMRVVTERGLAGTALRIAIIQHLMAIGAAEGPGVLASLPSGRRA